MLPRLRPSFSQLSAAAAIAGLQRRDRRTERPTVTGDSLTRLQCPSHRQDCDNAGSPSISPRARGERGQRSAGQVRTGRHGPGHAGVFTCVPHCTGRPTGRVSKQRGRPAQHPRNRGLGANTRLQRREPAYGKYEHKFERPGMYIVGCDIHSTMRADILITATPYITTSNPDGSFTIANVRPGAYN